MNVSDVAQRIGDRLDEAGIAYAVGGALALGVGRPKDVVDLERLAAVRNELDYGYVRAWLMKMVPTNDRVAVLDDLERRFAKK